MNKIVRRFWSVLKAVVSFLVRGVGIDEFILKAE